MIGLSATGGRARQGTCVYWGGITPCSVCVCVRPAEAWQGVPQARKQQQAPPSGKEARGGEVSPAASDPSSRAAKPHALSRLGHRLQPGRLQGPPPPARKEPGGTGQGRRALGSGSPRLQPGGRSPPAAGRIRSEPQGWERSGAQSHPCRAHTTPAPPSSARCRAGGPQETPGGEQRAAGTLTPRGPARCALLRPTCRLSAPLISEVSSDSRPSAVGLLAEGAVCCNPSCLYGFHHPAPLPANLSAPMRPSL